MTGAAAGPLGGNGGAAFGSGLTSFTLSPGEKIFNSFLEPWLKKSEEDKQIHELHRQEFNDLSGKKLGVASAIIIAGCLTSNTVTTSLKCAVLAVPPSVDTTLVARNADTHGSMSLLPQSRW